ncbi:hypothetical protein L3X38_035108 [Prunus dulcis]|uniref:Uncharacterized protein n=1 Tax=Prunus dulcis TaxID=3755 RepID=A0AAD4YYH9_PRUDU|nr:hypothetical protein L3X38_035108 [Prunus dulcis]
MADSAKGEFQESKKMVSLMIYIITRQLHGVVRKKDSINPSLLVKRRLTIRLIRSEDNVEVVKLSSVCFLNVRGQFKMSELSAGVVYVGGPKKCQAITPCIVCT